MIGEMDQISRANLINSITGYKPANLIGTISDDGSANLAIFSSVVHIGAHPPLMGFISRPVGEAERHTYENIKQTRFFTINHVHEAFIKKAHWTSAKFERGVSEFEKCGLTEEYLDGFPAPYVAESRIKIGLEFADEIPIAINRTKLVIGKVKHIILPDKCLLENGSVDLNAVDGVCISGLDTYHKAVKIETFPYARPGNLPQF
jgi:flavin reductase (DIM6/NTAB) family NADH-FMN oxidoreductase RutF